VERRSYDQGGARFQGVWADMVRGEHERVIAPARSRRRRTHRRILPRYQRADLRRRAWPMPQLMTV